jgi:hypothetical protein
MISAFRYKNRNHAGDMLAVTLIAVDRRIGVFHLADQFKLLPDGLYRLNFTLQVYGGQ